MQAASVLDSTCSERATDEVWHPMIERFRGETNLPRLIAALRQQPVLYSDEIAGEVAKQITLRKFARGELLIRQGDPDDHLFFVLAGRVSIEVNGREVAIRSAGQHVGEMALIDPAARRSASVRALEDLVVASMTEARFTNLADKFPRCWRLLSQELCARLRQRDRFVSTPNPRPVLFIGSSKESLDVARAIQSDLKHDDIVIRVWTDGVFGASNFPIEDLEEQIKTSDFAVLVLTPDDTVVSRKVQSGAPRDNAVFELGLFMGALSRRRTFLLTPKAVEVKIPSDLLGLTPLSYAPGQLVDLPKKLKAACSEIRKRIQELGPK